MVVKLHSIVDNIVKIVGDGSFELRFDMKDAFEVAEALRKVNKIPGWNKLTSFGIITGLVEHNIQYKSNYFGNYITYDNVNDLIDVIKDIYMPNSLNKKDINKWLGVKRFDKKKFRDKLSTLSLSSVDRIYQLRKEGNNETSSSRQK